MTREELAVTTDNTRDTGFSTGPARRATLCGSPTGTRVDAHAGYDDRRGEAA